MEQILPWPDGNRMFFSPEKEIQPRMTTPQVSLSGNLAFTYARKPSHEIGLLEVFRNSLKQYFFHLSLYWSKTSTEKRNKRRPTLTNWRIVHLFCEP